MNTANNDALNMVTDTTPLLVLDGQEDGKRDECNEWIYELISEIRM